jgi:hypothetical protein
MRHTITCRKCGEKFSAESPWAKLCGPCKKASKTLSVRKHNGIGQGPNSYQKQMPKPKKPVMPAGQVRRLNHEQHRFNMDLDARLYSDCTSSPVRVIRPTDPDFETIARTVTPINRITREDHLPMVMPFGRHYLENGGFRAR